MIHKVSVSLLRLVNIIYITGIKIVQKNHEPRWTGYRNTNAVVEIASEGGALLRSNLVLGVQYIHPMQVMNLPVRTRGPRLFVAKGKWQFSRH